MLLKVWAKMRRVVRSQRTRRSVSRAIESLETRFLLTTWTGDIPNGTVWAAGQVQQIGGNVHIPAGSTLTIQPGAVVKFDNVYNFTVDGTLLAQGTGVAPIVFTDIHDDVGGDTNGDGTNSGPGNGDWGSLSFQSDSTGSILDHVDVRFGGRNAASELLVNGGQLTFSNGIIRNSITAGVRIQNSTPTLTNISYQNNNSAAVSMDLASNPTVSGVTVSQNGINGLVLDAGTIAGNAVWDDPDIVYWFSGNITVPQGKTLAIGAGQVIKRNIGQDLLVNGTLTAAGTQAAPIIFADFDDDTAGGDTNNNGTNSGPFNGGTGEIVFSNTSTANVLDHVDVRNARSVAAAAVVDDGAPLTFTNSMIRYSDSVGLRIQNSNPTLTNMTYQGNQRAAASMDLMSNPAISGVTMLGNGVNGLLLDGGTLTGNAFWNDADIVYWFTNDITVPQGNSLTIGPGQIIKRDIGQDLFINGTLNAMGTQAAPIIFADRDDDTAGGDTNNNGTNSGAGNGGTGAIVFSNTSTANVLDHVAVRNARNVDTAAVVVNGAPLTFTNSIISQTDTVGLRIQSSNPILTNMTYQGNHGAAISTDLVSQPAISGVTLSNNWVNALSLDSGSIVVSRVWDSPDIVYWFTGNVTVPQGLSLTIGAGQIIKRDVAQNLFVNGSLIADGTQSASIIFADRNDDSAGGDTNDDGSNTFSLNGGTGEIVFSNTSTANVLDHTEVRNARFIDTAAVVVNGAPLTFTNSLIAQSDGAGLRIQSSNPVLTNMTYQNNNGAAVSMDLLSSPVISGVTMLNNRINALTVDGGTLTNNSVWDDPDIVYWLSGSITVSQGKTLTIAAGQVIKRNNAQDLIVNGTLNATGTETAPIIFADENDDTAGGDTNNDGTNSGPLNGGTGEIEFLSPSTGSILDHVEVRNARFVATAAVVVDHASLTFTNSLIVQSDEAGLRIQSSNPVLTNMTFQNNNGAAVSMDLAAAPTISGVTLLNNRINGLTIDGGTLSSNASWNNPDIVYVLSGATGTITIPQGVTLNVGAGQVIKVNGPFDAFDVNGTLNTQGTAAAQGLRIL